MALKQEFNFQDVVIRLAGLPVAGAQGISYTASQESPNIYGLGREPRSYAKKRREYEGEITVTGGQLNEILQAVAPIGDLLSLPPFEVSVTYVNESGDLWSDVLSGCRFTEVPKELVLDDDFMEVTLPLAIAKISYNTLA